MIDINIFTEMFTEFYFGKWLIIGSAVYGMMKCIKILIRR